MFLPYFVPQLETKAWAVILLVVNGISIDGVINPFYLIMQNEAVRRGSGSLEQVRTFASSSFSVVMSSGRILGSVIFGGFFNEHLGYYFTCLIYAVIALLTLAWHVIFLARVGLLRRAYYPTSLEITK